MKWQEKWLRQTFCNHHAMRTTAAETAQNGYLFKCSKCGKYLNWSIESGVFGDFRFWAGIVCGSFMFYIVFCSLPVIVKH